MYFSETLNQKWSQFPLPPAKNMNLPQLPPHQAKVFHLILFLEIFGSIPGRTLWKPGGGGLHVIETYLAPWQTSLMNLSFTKHLKVALALFAEKLHHSCLLGSKILL